MISTKLAAHIVGCIPHIVCHISGKHLLLYPHDCWFNPHFFPTSLCGVLIFDSVSRLLPLSHNNFVTHHLSHTTLSHIIFHTHTPLSHNNFVTLHLCHTSSFTHNFVTHLLSHTTLSHIIFHTHLCHTTTLSHIIFRTQLCHTPSFTYNFVTHHLSLRDIHLRIVWQVWHLWHWAGSGGALGRAWARLVAGDAAQLCVAGVALGNIHLRFAWQAWHLETSAFVWHLGHWAGSGGVLGPD